MEKSAPNRSEWDWRRDAVAKSIAKVKPTICAVQEAESRRVLWYLTQSLERQHSLVYEEVCPESRDAYTEQDVGFLYRQPADLLATTIFRPSRGERASGNYYDVSKHVLGLFEVPTGKSSDDRPEQVLVMNIHLRSTVKAAAIRVRQARLLYHWLAESIRQGSNVIVLGDFNTETEPGESSQQTDPPAPLTEMQVAGGLEQRGHENHLVDLQTFEAPGHTQTHLLHGRSFDRILVSQSLLDDDPARVDLVFDSIEVRPDLCVQGDVDQPQEHWDRYWQMSRDERDLSDHFPVLATFNLH